MPHVGRTMRHIYTYTLLSISILPMGFWLFNTFDAWAHGFISKSSIAIENKETLASDDLDIRK